MAGAGNVCLGNMTIAQALPAAFPEFMSIIRKPVSGIAPHVTNISFIAEAEPPGVGPPAMTYILPLTVAAPSPWRAVGMGRSARQSLVLGS
jgi:hypothetical protein